MIYIERRLNAIDARIDDLCGLLGDVLRHIENGIEVTVTSVEIREEDEETPIPMPRVWGDTEGESGG